MTAARRLIRTAGLLFGPVVWLFALLGAGLVAFPAWPLHGEDAPVRPSAAAIVDVWTGEAVFLNPATGALLPGAAWHPRVVAIDLLGEPLPDGWRAAFAEPPGDDVPPLAAAYRDGTAWNFAPGGARGAALGFAAGTTAAGTAQFREGAGRWDRPFDLSEVATADPSKEAAFVRHLGPPHRVRGFAVSPWPLLTLALLTGAGRLWVARRRDSSAEDAADRFGEARRLARPWGWGLAAVGLLCLAAKALPVGGAVWDAAVVRGPADVPHPRLLSVGWLRESRADPGPIGTDRSAPAAGVWFGRFVFRDARGGGFGAQSGLYVSLWYFAAAGLAGNAATLWRRASRADGGIA